MQRGRFGSTSIGLAFVLASCVQYRPAPLSAATTAATIESRSLSDSAFRRFLRRNLADTLAAPPDTAPVWGLTTLSIAGLYFSPDLDVARAQYAVAQSGVVTAGERPNPTLAVVPTRTVSETEQAATREAGATPWALSFSLDLPLELFHRRGYRISQAQHVADSARFALAQTAWTVRAGVRAALLDLVSARERVGLRTTLVAERDQLVQLLEQRLAVGEVSQLDVSRERALRDQAHLDLRADERAAATALPGLAASIGLPASALARVPIAGSTAEFVLSDTPPNLDSLRRAALLGRPDVLAALAGYGAAESALALEVAQQYPDLHLLPELAWDRGEEKISAGASAVLPILSRNRGPILEATARRRVAATRVLQLQSRVVAQLDSSLTAYRSAAAALATADSLVGAEQSAVRSVEAQFRAGEVDRVALVSAQLDVASATLARLDVLLVAARAAGQLENAVQRPIVSVR